MRCRGHGFNPRVGKIPWRREWQPTPVFLPGESHGQRSLGGYSPRGRKELDTTEGVTPPPTVSNRKPRQPSSLCTGAEDRDGPFWVSSKRDKAYLPSYPPGIRN